MDKKPCKECPFKKNSAKGYLGEASGDPELFLNSMEESPIPCHLVINWNEDTEEKIAKKSLTNTCIGSLQFMKNSCKLPFNREYARLVQNSERNDEVFNWKKDFIAYHKY